MVLEATILVLDNSEWMRNGDYTPSRIEAQKDATNFLFNAKTQMNPENTVGLMTMAGKSPEVLVTLTAEIGKILTAMHHVQIGGKANFATGVQIAQIALKHRQNKNQKQRIIVFVGSPLDEDEKSLVRLGKKLKKNNVAVDVISFGEVNENSQKLEAFIDAVSSGDNSHLVPIPPGPHILSDVIVSSPMFAGEDGAPAGFASGGFEFGVDPNLDPELALALRMSMEEEQARQAAARGEPAGDAASGGDAMAIDNAPIAAGGAPNQEDDELALALAMSMGHGGETEVRLLCNEDEAMARAIAMSMGQGSDQQQVDMGSILSSLPGVDMNDPRLQAALGGQAQKDEKKEGEESEEKK
ncbi:hypothetical protein BC832DRAFT_533315 [Gaertneriomyces semiglobifer]|nr:hypothetical protein BC832DRAFT_533315 [Gaertneriomyces semiglobifer]